MKVVILAGGYGTRISEETAVRPKPLIEIGDKPILWHIMKIYSHYGFHEFVIPLGYKGVLIKEYFAHYDLHESDVTFDFSDGGKRRIHQRMTDPWKVTLVDTGKDTSTGGRIARIGSYLADGPFMLTYGDGVSDIDLSELVRFHRSHGKWATVTAVQPGGRFGALELGEGGGVRGFREKPRGDGGWMNGGFFVFEPEALAYMGGDDTMLEKEPLESLARLNQLMAYRHEGFWHPMDTLRDKVSLEALWKSGGAPWRVWRS
ncbi:glucose-1-phosphate cytidylyltransferase [Cohnella sp. CIP 111063]|uniref:glucose-1-phosphate cytidylyltransferase n=1 Tax=unclassified Cohnella TaxID=2636738 RepID=UPI000B8C34C3|nr:MULTISPECIES: glucose-1-phosphate cytidylyltransferase [unclassified Cohnella]OXS61713.1 glucose-1-phosphate cytidylyltransferase [Cohnella sp. CIP 111063]PRX74145.1 glucose-1-phosphate cytidylyltransferase [Cohnella sp. SGD-V74]